MSCVFYTPLLILFKLIIQIHKYTNIQIHKYTNIQIIFINRNTQIGLPKIQPRH